ncbi:toxin TcdB middle/N-terminal domain-containing protein [Apibacter sp. B2912]|uniref:toxin TcdB middle/N-terminal domain-containing protein n=1 Tax=Apibacter sp. B2912 TaxID=2656763 RepID=UPI00136D5B1E|nr:toxin TcdB middle/N-terminal domain-containing protein [Apibacter sp. B2912]MXO32552.1 type IV secretion protein Rhs [Apibacter sp. B2912]
MKLNSKQARFVSLVLLTTMALQSFSPYIPILEHKKYKTREKRVTYTKNIKIDQISTDSNKSEEHELNYLKIHKENQIDKSDTSLSTLYSSKTKEGMIGILDDKNFDNPEDNIFTVYIDQKPLQNHKAYLIYELYGVSDKNGISKSINDRISRGGYLVKKHYNWTKQKEPINSNWLQQGENYIQFSIPKDATYGYKIKNLKIEIEKQGSILEPLQWEAISYKGGDTYVKGYFPDEKNRKIQINNVQTTTYQGEFEAILSGNVNTIELVSEGKTYVKESTILSGKPDFTNLLQTALDQKQIWFKKDKETNEINLLGAELLAKGINLNSDKKISIQGLRDVDIPALDMGMKNVTAKADGYKFLPHGEHFKEGATIKLAYDRTKIPNGYTEKDIRTYYFDLESRHWVALERDSVDTKNQVIISRTTHFTDMINGVIQAPESPETNGFTPTTMSDIKVADPLSKVNLISAPSANNRGSAALSYTFEMPPARNGMSPSLGIQYNSDGGSGWLGEGWDMNIPSITVDTRWGVPRYDTSKETETYTMDGTQLVTLGADGNTSIAHRGEKIARKSDRLFYSRKEGSFATIQRKGTNPGNYTWEVTNRKGVKYTYGGNGGILKGTVTDISGKSKDVITEWKVSRVEELHGDWIEYIYEQVEEPIKGGLKSKALYLKEVHAGNKGQNPHTVVKFTSAKTKQKETNSARYGFFTSSNRLLTHVEIDFEGSKLREYELKYKSGAFYTDLLDKITHKDDKGKEFTSNRFDYYDDVKSQEGYIPFNQQEEVWARSGEKINQSKTTSYGGSFYTGVGIFNGDAIFNSGTLGGSYSYSNSVTEGKSTFIDINGDGLTDKVYQKNGVLYYEPHLLTPLKGEKFGKPIAIKGINKFSKTKSTSSNGGGSARAGIGLATATVGISGGTTNTTTTVYFADVNSDGLIDLVSNGKVYFNRITRDSDGNLIPSFTLESSLTPSPIMGGGTIDSSDTAVDPQEQKDLIYNSPLYDVVKVWEAPFDGKIKIEGNVQLQAPTGDYDTEEYEKADGVRVAIQYKGKEKWNKSINKGDFTNYPANVKLSETVKKGDKIYFRVQSGNQEMSNGSFDQVQWNPVITYEQTTLVEADLNSINPDGQKMYRFPSSESHIASQDVATSVGDYKKAVIFGTFEKPITSDDVTVKVIQTNDNRSEEIIIYEKTFNWNESHQGNLEIPVPEGKNWTNFYFTLSSPSQVNWKKISWKPQIKLDDSQEAEPGSVNYSIYHQKWEGSYYPLVFENASQTKKISLSFQALANDPMNSSLLNGELAITIKKNTGLLGRYIIRVENGIVVTPPLMDLEVAANESLSENIWVEAFTKDATIIKNLKALTFTLQPDNGLSSNGYANIFVKDSDKGFGPMYRGWGQFIYNANAGRYARPIDEKELQLPQNENADMDPRTMIFIPMGLDNETKSYWTGADRYVYIKEGILSASRLGEKEVKLTNPLEGLSSKSPSSGSCIQGSSAIGVKLTSKSKNTTKQAGASFGVGVNYNDSEGSDETTLSFSDMNGDGYPDIITKNKIQFTNTRGGFDGEVIDSRNGFTGNHRSTSTSKAYGLGANPITAVSIFNKLTGGEKQNSLDSKASQVGISAVNLSFSAPKMSEIVEHTLIDLNGDGLPDKVYKNGKVRLNLGYSFTPEVDWDLNEIQRASSKTISGGADMGIDIIPKSDDKASSSFAGGVNVTSVTNNPSFKFIDVNNDGLLDKVFVKEGKVWVALNLGLNFDVEREWPQLTQIAKSTSVSVSTNVAYTLNIVIPLLIAPTLKISLNPGLNTSNTTGQTLFEIKDVDGDGYPDMVWTDSSGSIKVKRSTIGRTNKLSKVSNSIGGKFMLDYNRSEATYEHPGGKWVLSSVEIDDGIHDDGANMRTEYRYLEGKQDRHEREFLGFGKVEKISINTENNNQVYRKTIEEYDVTNFYTSGNLLKTTITDAQGKKYAQTENKYYQYEVKQKENNNYTISSNIVCSDYQASFAPLQYTRNMVFEGKDQGIVTNETWYSYDLVEQYGELSNYRYSDSGNLGENGAGSYNYQTSVSYTSNPNKNIFGLPVKVQVKGSGGSVQREVTAEYDLNYVNHLTRVRQKLNDKEESVTDITYDKYGNITQKTLPANTKGQRMWYKYRYDKDYHMYVERIDDAYGYTSLLENYDYRYGIPLTSKDINGYFTETTIDNLGRIETITGPNELELDLPYTIKYRYNPSVVLNSDGDIENPAYAITYHYNPQHPTEDIKTLSFVDGAGKTLQVKKDGVITHTDANGSNPQDEKVLIVSGRTMLDPFGRVVKSYYPITESPEHAIEFNRNFDKVNPSVSNYDLLDRTVATILPDSSTQTTEYTINPTERQQVTIFTDAMGGKQKTYANGSGLTVKTEQLSGPSGIITTRYTYDGINQLLEVIDTEGQITQSKYDLAGRRIHLSHPSAGITQLSYDALGNVISRQTSNLEKTNQKIEYEYDYTRLKSIHYPEHPQNNVTYYYGDKNSKYNRIGKVMLQEDATGAQEFKYGTLGEITEVRRTVIIPNQAIATYVTQTKYDSWNKLEQIIYPDQEKVDYIYNTAGLLTGIKGSKAYSYDYVNKIGYDKFEQRNYLKYCNGSETTYTYDPERRRLSDLQVWVSPKTQGGGVRTQIINNKYTYDAVSNVLSVSNQAPLPQDNQKTMGGQMQHDYTYDGLYRLVQAQGSYTGADNKTAAYSLQMGYDNLHNIVSKNQQVSQQGIMIEGGLKAGYDLQYTYDSTKKNQIKTVQDINYREEESQEEEKRQEHKNYHYDLNGNLTYVNVELEKKDLRKTSQTQERKLRWDEENRLMAIDDNGYVSNYVYDASGERVIKTSGESEQVYINSLFSGGNTETQGFTAYINPFLVVSPNGKYTKHYYAGSQRIVSKLGDIESFGADPRRIEYAGSSVPGVTINWKAKYQRSIEDIKGNYAYFEVPYNGKDNDDYVNGEGFCCSQSTALRAGIGIGNVNYEKMQYYYHPDHLGSSSYITNLDGEIVQHVEYVPFGEVFIEERNNSWNTPYLFNGKELDEETGLYYYGARYYNPRESVWLSVDPLAELAPNMSPYRYAFNNPTNFIDPYGLFETRKEARQYRREHGIDGKIHKAKDGTFSIDDYRNSVSYSRSSETKEVEQAVLVVGSRRSWNPYNNLNLSSASQRLRNAIRNNRATNNVDIARDISHLMQSGGNIITLVGYGATLTGVGAPFGIITSKIGNIISLAGTGLEILVDYSTGNFTDGNIDAAKLLILEGGQSIINKRLRLLPGVNNLTKEILEQNVNLKFMLGEYIYDYYQDNKSKE